MTTQTRKTIPHGTISRYVNRSCRCSSCREAWRDYQRTYHESHKDEIAESHRRAIDEGRVAHGTRTAYSYGCRCLTCRTAMCAYQRERRAAS